MVAAKEEVVKVFCRVREMFLYLVTAARGDGACQEKGTHNVFVYRGVASMYELSAMLREFAKEASPFTSCFVNA